MAYFSYVFYIIYRPIYKIVAHNFMYIDTLFTQ